MLTTCNFHTTCNRIFNSPPLLWENLIWLLGEQMFTWQVQFVHEYYNVIVCHPISISISIYSFLYVNVFMNGLIFHSAVRWNVYNGMEWNVLWVNISIFLALGQHFDQINLMVNDQWSLLLLIRSYNKCKIKNIIQIKPVSSKKWQSIYDSRLNTGLLKLDYSRDCGFKKNSLSFTLFA